MISFFASGSITFEGMFVVSGIKVMRAKSGDLFVAYPSWKNSDGEYKDVCFPMTKSTSRRYQYAGACKI